MGKSSEITSRMKWNASIKALNAATLSSFDAFVDVKDYLFTIDFTWIHWLCVCISLSDSQLIHAKRAQLVLPIVKSCQAFEPHSPHERACDAQNEQGRNSHLMMKGRRQWNCAVPLFGIRDKLIVFDMIRISYCGNPSLIFWRVNMYQWSKYGDDRCWSWVLSLDWRLLLSTRKVPSIQKQCIILEVGTQYF